MIRYFRSNFSERDYFDSDKDYLKVDDISTIVKIADKQFSYTTQQVLRLSP